MKNNLFDYLEWRGDLSFDEAPFNEVDNLILANLTYIRFTNLLGMDKNGISLKKLHQLFIAQDKQQQVYRDENDVPFFEALAKTNRFKNVKAFYHQEIYDVDKEVQFGAVSFKITNKLCYVAFRGTDNAVVGWKEDLDLVFKIVPAQLAAKEYLDEVAKATRAKLYVGGHSKGGNLAVFAASHCKLTTYRRILKVFNNDGPGFDENVIKPAKLERISTKIINYVPKSSMVSVMMDGYGEQSVVNSFNVGIMQHDPYSWEILGNQFVKADKRDASSQFVEKTLRNWLSKIDYNDRRAFVNGLFDIIYASQAEEIKDIVPGIVKNFKNVQNVLNQMDQKTKEAMSLVLKELWNSLGNSVSGVFLKKDHDESMPGK